MRNANIIDIIIQWAEKVEFLAPFILGIVFLVAVFLILRSGVRLRRYLDRIRVEDGEVMRELTAEERMQIAQRLAWKRGKWFWPLVGMGLALAAAGLAIVWKLGLL